jgi:hypothetical protein
MSPPPIDSHSSAVCKTQRHCPELRLVAVTLPGSCQFPQSRERGNMHVVADRVSRGHAYLFQVGALRLRGD